MQRSQCLARASGRKTLVFGDMGELGVDAPRLHHEIGACAKEARIDRMLTLGENAVEAAKASATAQVITIGSKIYSPSSALQSDRLTRSS